MTQKEMEYMRALGARPALALRRWKSFDDAHRWVVVSFMTLFYTAEFAQYFNKVASQPGQSIKIPLSITNMTSPQQLMTQGYRPLKGPPVPGVDVWVHPSGAEVWLMSGPKLPPPPLPEDPAISEAKGYADLHTNEFSRLSNLSDRVKMRIGKPDYGQLFNQLSQAIDKWNQDTSRDKDIAQNQLKPAVDDSDVAKVQEQIDRMDNLQKRVVELTQGKDDKGGYTLAPNGPVYW
jgi:hypothetical protein